jgi:hypothetical protein
MDTGSSSSSAAHGLSVDYMAQTVYYASSDDLAPDQASSIMAARIDGTRVVRIRDTAAQVRQVIVVPSAGLLFWHEVSQENGTESILRAWMDGTEATAIVTVVVATDGGDDLQQQTTASAVGQSAASSIISNLTYSQTARRLYWLQQKAAGQQQQQLLLLHYYDLQLSQLGQGQLLQLSNATALTEHNGTLYVGQQTEAAGWTIAAYDVSSSAAAEAGTGRVIRNLTHPVLSLAVYDPDSQQERNKCSVNNGGCAHLCVPVKQGKNRGFHILGIH